MFLLLSEPIYNLVKFIDIEILKNTFYGKSQRQKHALILFTHFLLMQQFKPLLPVKIKHLSLCPQNWIFCFYLFVAEIKLTHRNSKGGCYITFLSIRLKEY